MQIIASLEDPGTQSSRAECARQYGVTPAAISKLMKVRQSVKKRYSDAGADAGALRDKRQRGGFSKNVAFEDELYKWICSVRARHVPLLVAHVQQKAKLLASRYKMNDDFKASNGWYYRFCGRYGLTPASLHAGAPAPLQTSVETEPPAPTPPSSGYRDSSKWTELTDTVAQYSPELVYTVSEARLFYQMLPRAIDVVPEHTGASSTGMIADAAADAAAVERSGATLGPGKTARVLVLVCANGTGTHKIPLLVVGKEKVPPCLAALHAQLLRGGINNAGVSGPTIYNGVGMGASYFSQREVWCDDRTFKHWCERVFLPAVRQRTTQPVLLVAENPGGRLAAFQQENVSTVFLPLRTGGGVGATNSQQASGITSDAGGGMSAPFQPLHNAVIRDLKRRYKICLFQERLSFLEIPAEEKYRLIQRAGKKPVGTAGVALGRVPHLIDAMSILDEAWVATPPALIRNCWVKSNLKNNALLASSVPIASAELSDDAVVVELCSMLRNMNLVDDMNKLAKDLRQWLYADDDSSEQMQQELLYDIQQLLQEEEQQGVDKDLTQQQQQQQLDQFEQQQRQNAFMDSSGVPTSFEPSQSGSYVYHTTDGRAASVSSTNPTTVLDEKRKSIELALQALADAEEALDNADVAEYFGEEATGQALESITRGLRRLRRIRRGKQSALVAVAVNAAASGDTNDRAGGALSTHEYFYGNGSLKSVP
ncbi:unnamed protein product [Phytophthora lilii]|uniref:Unnamed protein product n=1 Tax=Phytophthora lilii TaxID=2077276 RepID=A0A9W6YJW0_9STRA|nr:unnamed protein product [Phytophthora lilii]